MASAPASPLLTGPQLSDFYVHHHFLQFARLYHAALSGPSASAAVAPAAAASLGQASNEGGGSSSGAAGGGGAALRACRAHLGVMLEMARRAPGGGGVRRRFLQLHVLDFLLRELSLEHGVKHQVGLALFGCDEAVVCAGSRSGGVVCSMGLKAANRCQIVGACTHAVCVHVSSTQCKLCSRMSTCEQCVHCAI